MTRRLYTFRLTEESLQNEGNTNQKSLERLAGIQNQGSVSSSGTEPGDITLDGQLRDDYAELLGTELRELLSAPGIEYLEYYRVGADSPDAGYYPADSNRGGRVQPQTGGVVSFDVSLVREGTRDSHRRRIKTNTASVTHSFGSSTAARVGVPADAIDVQWLDTDGTERADATPEFTENAEFGDVDVYRADDAPTGNNPQLVFDLAHQDAGNVDAAVFDTWGNAETDVQGRFGWQQVHAPDHEFRGDMVLENGLLRLIIDQTTDPHTLTAEEWNDSSGVWQDPGLGASDWELAEINLVSITPLAVRARTKWTDTGGSDTHVLDLALHRGWANFQFIEPADSTGALEQSGQAPSDLQNLLQPIAAASRTDPDPRRGLISRDLLPIQ